MRQAYIYEGARSPLVQTPTATAPSDDQKYDWARRVSGEDPDLDLSSLTSGETSGDGTQAALFNAQRMSAAPQTYRGSFGEADLMVDADSFIETFMARQQQLTGAQNQAVKKSIDAKAKSLESMDQQAKDLRLQQQETQKGPKGILGFLFKVVKVIAKVLEPIAKVTKLVINLVGDLVKMVLPQSWLDGLSKAWDTVKNFVTTGLEKLGDWFEQSLQKLGFSPEAARSIRRAVVLVETFAVTAVATALMAAATVFTMGAVAPFLAAGVGAVLGPALAASLATAGTVLMNAAQLAVSVGAVASGLVEVGNACINYETERFAADIEELKAEMRQLTSWRNMDVEAAKRNATRELEIQTEVIRQMRLKDDGRDLVVRAYA